VSVETDAAAPHVEDVAVHLDVSEFSSLLVGAVSFGALHRYGLADISDAAYIEVVERIFGVAHPPICTTPF
jgi:hypothetical protein